MDKKPTKTKRDIDFDNVEQRIKSGESMRDIAKDYGICHQTLSEHRRRHKGNPLRTHRKVTGGNAFIDRHGYLLIRTEDPTRVSRYTPQHILVAEEAMGRKLMRGEVVHHINGDKLDNRIDNLLVCTRSLHHTLHRSLEKLAMELVRSGEIILDQEEYKWNR